MTPASATGALVILGICLAVGWTAAVSGSGNPGLKIRLSQPGLDYAAEVTVQHLSANLSNAKLRDHREKQGDLEWEIKNLQIASFRPPKSRVILRRHGGLTWSLSGAKLSVRGLWSYKSHGLIRAKDHGSVEASVSSASISVTVTLGMSESGQPVMKATGCSCDLYDLHINVHEGWLLNIIVNILTQPIRDRLQVLLCSAAKTAIRLAAAPELRSLPLTVPIGPGRDWYLDYRLVSAPEFRSGYLESSHKAEFFNAGDHTEAPFQPAPLPSPSTADRMVTFWVSDYVLNTAGYVLHKRGVFRYRITKDELPEAERYRLNASCCQLFCGCIGDLFPSFGRKFPNASVEVEATTTEPPTASVEPQNITATFVGVVKFRARLPDGSLADLFAVDAVLKVLLTPRLEDRVIKARIGSITETLTLASSAVDNINVAGLTLFFDAAKKTFIVPRLDDIGERGLPLPVIRHVEFTNSRLRLAQRCVEIATDVKHRP